MPCACSQAGASGPRTMAAVEAALASRAEAPAQLTWAHVDGAVRPVLGSTMWWARLWPGSVAQVRSRVDEVARPWPVVVTTWATAPSAVCTPTLQPPAGSRPLTAMSPPRLTRNPPGNRSANSPAMVSAANALAVAPRSMRQPAGTVTRSDASISTFSHPGTSANRVR
ncbi:MAG: hypothetical protein BWY91_03278 [bacterium ADurb.BinA028]|nr:MAG: hypothetical protein BWY91_03278 [bacterium ADurb.BinA028]